ncbi:hypothetical protein ACEU6E_03805 [Halorutilales archaeon Cl-col2-1]
MASGARIDYARTAKLGFVTGVGMFVVGAVGETAGNAVLGGLPDWEDVLLTDMMGLGILLAFVSVFVVGVFLPIALE